MVNEIICLDHLNSLCDNLEDNNNFIKISYIFNETKVRCYYSRSINGLPSFQLVIFNGENYYFKPINLNSDQSDFDNKYLDSIKKDLLKSILVNGTLESFYNILRKNLNTSNLNKSNTKKISYLNDIELSMAVGFMKKNRIGKIKPFFSHLAKRKMSLKQFQLVKKSLFISKEDLNIIRLKGFTIYTTYDIKRSKNFSKAFENLIK